eukprot:TRINITY_DN765_c0_g1_i1.p1 TRINITY_DN765_c0_g1~~TRINITY_DN765_c0_g1_i1.p1  ORF type:complete len:119 (-),score=6.90 TRINITY_DN765_c0_g1_i1:177-533(-)
MALSPYSEGAKGRARHSLLHRSVTTNSYNRFKKANKRPGNWWQQSSLSFIHLKPYSDAQTNIVTIPTLMCLATSDISLATHRLSKMGYGMWLQRSMRQQPKRLPSKHLQEQQWHQKKQ